MYRPTVSFFVWGVLQLAKVGARGPGPGPRKPKNKKPNNILAHVLVNHRCNRWFGFLKFFNGFDINFGSTVNAQTMLHGANK